MPTAEVLSAVPTPFDDDGAIQHDVFRALLARLDPRVDGVFVAGTTGEFPALDDTERQDLFAAAVEVLGPDRVVAHVGSAAPRQTVRLATAAADLGITRVAALTPYYLPCDFAQVQALFAGLCAELPQLAVFVYLFPERSGLDVSPAELGELTAVDGVAGAKLSGRPNQRFADYVAAAGPGSAVYSGDAATYAAVVAAGGRGVVSGVSSAYPEVFAALRTALRSGTDHAAASAEVVEVSRVVGPTVMRLKYALSHRHGETWSSRMSLPAVGPDVAADIRGLG